MKTQYLKIWGTCTGEGRLRKSTEADIALHNKLTTPAFEDGSFLDSLEAGNVVDGAEFGFPGHRVYICGDQPHNYAGEEDYDY